MRRGLWLASIGVIAGVAGSVAVARLLAGLLFEVRATEPITLAAAVAASVMAVALAACLLPARRAARVAPAELLRAG